MMVPSLVRAAALAALVAAPAAAQPRLAAVAEEGWDATAVWQGLGGTPISTRWSLDGGAWDCLQSTGASDHAYCIACADGCAGWEVAITGTVTALGPADWTTVTDTVRLRCAGTPTDPEDPAGEDPEDPAGEDPEDPAGEDPEDPAGEDPEDPAGEDPEDPEGPEPVPALPLAGLLAGAAAVLAVGSRSARRKP